MKIHAICLLAYLQAVSAGGGAAAAPSRNLQGDSDAPPNPFIVMNPKDPASRVPLDPLDYYPQDGEGHVVPNIVGGEEVNPPGKYPYFVHMGGCGASLVAPNAVLSAAHCASLAAPGAQVKLGLHGRFDSGSEVETLVVAQRVVHPNYNSNSLENDFMMLKLVSPSEKTPVVLNNDDLPDGDDLVVFGFGALSQGGSQANVIQEVEVDYIPTTATGTCGSYSSGSITDAMLCAGRLNKDSCQGDSGGPIISKTTGKQVGVVSWGFGCADPAYPGVYARVSDEYQWIQETIQAFNAPPTPPPTPEPCTAAQSVAEVQLLIDNYGGETEWELEAICPGRDGEVVASGGNPPYASNTPYSSGNICVDEGKYRFTITDSWGDGICCDYGAGYYKVLWDGDVHAEGGDFTDSDTAEIGTDCNTLPITTTTTATTTTTTETCKFVDVTVKLTDDTEITRSIPVGSAGSVDVVSKKFSWAEAACEV